MRCGGAGFGKPSSASVVCANGTRYLRGSIATRGVAKKISENVAGGVDNSVDVLYYYRCKERATTHTTPNRRTQAMMINGVEYKIEIGADLTDADLTDAVLRCAYLRDAILTGADLTDADLAGADLTLADLTGADLTLADLTGADLTLADLTGAYLTLADLTGADLRSAVLRSANLSGAKGLLNPAQFIRKNFRRAEDGRLIVYKTFGSEYAPPESWKIEPGSYITEVCNANRTDDCGCGVNVATREWVDSMNASNAENASVWECRIDRDDECGIVVPYNTDGKIRCERVQLIRIVHHD